MKRLRFARAAAVTLLCAAALLLSQGASASVESRIVDDGPPAAVAGSHFAGVVVAGLPAARVITARRLAASERLPDQVDQLNRAARALCGSPHDAEDLVQETFARV